MRFIVRSTDDGDYGRPLNADQPTLSLRVDERSLSLCSRAEETSGADGRIIHRTILVGLAVRFSPTGGRHEAEPYAPHQRDVPRPARRPRHRTAAARTSGRAAGGRRGTPVRSRSVLAEAAAQ